MQRFIRRKVSFLINNSLILHRRHQFDASHHQNDKLVIDAIDHLSLAGDHFQELQLIPPGRTIVHRHGVLSELLHVRVADVSDRSIAIVDMIFWGGGDSIEKK